VPLEEIHASKLNFHVPGEIRGYWPRLVAKALAEDLGPISSFSPPKHHAKLLAASSVFWHQVFPTGKIIFYPIAMVF